MNDLATDKQLKLMDKMNLPYDIHRTTKYEASAMIDKAMRDGDFQGQGSSQPRNSFHQPTSVNTQNLIVAQVAVKCAVDLVVAGKVDIKVLNVTAQGIYNLIKEVGK